MILKNKSSLELLSDIKNLVKTEKECTFQILNYLKEIESRKLFLTNGCSSLFTFCTEFLEYSEPEAMNRIQAMRLMKSIPEVEVQIKSGELSLTSAAYIQTAFRKEDKFRKDKGQATLNVSEKRNVLQKTKNTSTRECQKTLVSFFPESIIKQEKIKAISSQQTKIEVVISDTLMKKLNKIKNLTAHKNYDGSMEKLLEIMADITLDKVDKLKTREDKVSKFKLAIVRELKIYKTNNVKNQKLEVEKINKNIAQTLNADNVEAASFRVLNVDKIDKTLPRALKLTDKNLKRRISPVVSRSRYIPNRLKQIIYNRDKEVCQYIDPLSNKSCPSQYGLELDHKFPYSRGGKTEISNLQLLCSQHNKFKKDMIEI